MSTDDIDPDVLEVLIQERSRGRRGSPEEAKRKRERQKLVSALDNAMRRADQHGFSDALRNGGIAEGSAAWKNAWTAYHAYQSRR
ncbi:MAG: hypothetical protein WBE13_13475 [Candidatus Acidiferrum sp.]